MIVPIWHHAIIARVAALSSTAIALLVARAEGIVGPVLVKVSVVPALALTIVPWTVAVPLGVVAVVIVIVPLGVIVVIHAIPAALTATVAVA